MITLLAALCLGAAPTVYALPLAEKAAIFQHDMEARFLKDGQALCKLKPPTPGRDFTAYNMPDNAYMTGMYLASQVMRHAVTGSETAARQARQSLEALHLLCTVSGTPGLLARAAWPADEPMADDGIWRPSPDGAWRWRGDVSSDQVAGVVYGYVYAYDHFAGPDERARIRENLVALADHIAAGERRIIGHDGAPTAWGRYDPEYVRAREPMNALLYLQLLKAGAHVTGDPERAAAYRRVALDEGYAPLAVRARRAFNPQLRGLVNHSDDVLLFLGYSTLFMLEEAPELLRHYRDSLQRFWRGDGAHPGVAPEANPLFAFLVAQYGEGIGDADLAAARATLVRFPFTMKWKTATRKQYAEPFSFDPAHAAPQSPPPSAGAVVPIDRRVKSLSAWVMDPYHSAGDDAPDHPMEFNGHDYLLAYWLGRHTGYIAPQHETPGN